MHHSWTRGCKYSCRSGLRGRRPDWRWRLTWLHKPSSGHLLKPYFRLVIVGVIHAFNAGLFNAQMVRWRASGRDDVVRVTTIARVTLVARLQRRRRIVQLRTRHALNRLIRQRLTRTVHYHPHDVH